MLKHSLPGLVLVLLTTVAFAETWRIESPDHRVAVVELYTSEGCSSCPPADAWLAELVRLPKGELDALVLALHVDYWDRLGWKDPYARAEYSERQRRLARLNRQRTLYTPEFLVDGKETQGTRRIIERIKQANAEPAAMKLQLQVERDPRQLRLTLTSPEAAGKNWNARFVVYEDGIVSEVESGENAGQRLEHERVVRHLGPALPLAGGLSRRIPLSPQWQPQNLGVGVLIEDVDGNYLQALDFRLPS